VAPELAQFVTLFEQDTTHRKLFKTGFTVHLNRSARDDFVKTSEELKRVANLAGQRKITAWVSVDTEDEMEKAIGAVLYGPHAREPRFTHRRTSQKPSVHSSRSQTSTKTRRKRLNSLKNTTFTTNSRPWRC
jgi:hypothetical protein